MGDDRVLMRVGEGRRSKEAIEESQGTPRTLGSKWDFRFVAGLNRTVTRLGR